MKIILNPPKESKANTLRSIYQTAVKEAKELFIINAYLAGWSMKNKLNPNCEKLRFIVGTDFGITRKDACKAVLKWLPKNLKDNFLAVDKISGFHPKLVMWKGSDGRVFLLLGSSNLTDAAFNTNYEANVFTEINSDSYSEITQWIESLRENASPISEDWLDHQYVEANRDKPIGKRKKQGPEGFPLLLPEGKEIEELVKNRRSVQKKFSQIKHKLIEIMEQSASGKINDLIFYKEMMKLWSSLDFHGTGND
jgi:HKD family nuclease